jgi:hypothetical protein
VQHQNAPNDTFAGERLGESVPGRAQIPLASHIDADIAAIRELRERIERVRENLAAPFRADLSAWLNLLSVAVDHRATDSRPVREALQEVMLSVGTGALATLSEPTRHRLAALTGIALPGHVPSGGRRMAEHQGDAGTEDDQADPDDQQSKDQARATPLRSQG